MSSKSKATKRTAPRPTKAASPESAPEAPEAGQAEEPRPLLASEGGVDMNRFVARYEAKVGKLTTENILLEEQLEGVKGELAQVKAALDDVVARLPKSEPADAPSDPAPAKKAATPKKQR